MTLYYLLIDPFTNGTFSARSESHGLLRRPGSHPQLSAPFQSIGPGSKKIDRGYPPFAQSGTDGGISYYVNVLKDLIRPESKRLNLNSAGRLPGALSKLPESIGALKEGDIPLVTALAYTVTALESQPYHSLDSSQNHGGNRCKTEYDLFARMRIK